MLNKYAIKNLEGGVSTTKIYAKLLKGDTKKRKKISDSTRNTTTIVIIYKENSKIRLSLMTVCQLGSYSGYKEAAASK